MLNREFQDKLQEVSEFRTGSTSAPSGIVHALASANSQLIGAQRSRANNIYRDNTHAVDKSVPSIDELLYEPGDAIVNHKSDTITILPGRAYSRPLADKTALNHPQFPLSNDQYSYHRKDNSPAGYNDAQNNQQIPLYNGYNIDPTTNNRPPSSHPTTSHNPQFPSPNDQYYYNRTDNSPAGSNEAPNNRQLSLYNNNPGTNKRPRPSHRTASYNPQFPSPNDQYYYNHTDNSPAGYKAAPINQQIPLSHDYNNDPATYNRPSSGNGTASYDPQFPLPQGKAMLNDKDHIKTIDHVTADDKKTEHGKKSTLASHKKPNTEENETSSDSGFEDDEGSVVQTSDDEGSEQDSEPDFADLNQIRMEDKLDDDVILSDKKIRDAFMDRGDQIYANAQDSDEEDSQGSAVSQNSEATNRSAASVNTDASQNTQNSNNSFQSNATNIDLDNGGPDDQPEQNFHGLL